MKEVKKNNEEMERVGKEKKVRHELVQNKNVKVSCSKILFDDSLWKYLCVCTSSVSLILGQQYTHEHSSFLSFNFPRKS